MLDMSYEQQSQQKPPGVSGLNEMMIFMVS